MEPASVSDYFLKMSRKKSTWQGDQRMAVEEVEWEYWVKYSLRGWGRMNYKLDEAGAAGWELVAVNTGWWLVAAYMKRPLEESAQIPSVSRPHSYWLKEQFGP